MRSEKKKEKEKKNGIKRAIKYQGQHLQNQFLQVKIK